MNKIPVNEIVEWINIHMVDFNKYLYNRFIVC